MKKCGRGRSVAVLLVLTAVLATALLGYENWQLRDELAHTRRQGEVAFATLYKCAVAEAKTCRVAAKGPEILRDFLPGQAILGPTEFAFLMENWSGGVGDSVRSYLHALEEPATFATAFLEEGAYE